MRLLFTATLRQLRLEVRRMMAADISGSWVWKWWALASWITSPTDI
jgi:hypothetical protein